MPQPARPKIYHIVHVDRLPSIIAEGGLLCDAEIVRRAGNDPAHEMGTTIGMGEIKQRRLTIPISSHPGLYVGRCVPFYFCTRSVMLYVIHRENQPKLTYRGGQGPIVHLEADLHAATQWADEHEHRWAFTLSNAGANYFEDRCNLTHLNEINWDAVQTNHWAGNEISLSVKDGKQAEFLMEKSFPWHLVEIIIVKSQQICEQVRNALQLSEHKPCVRIKPECYY